MFCARYPQTKISTLTGPSWDKTSLNIPQTREHGGADHIQYPQVTPNHCGHTPYLCRGNEGFLTAQ